MHFVEENDWEQKHFLRPVFLYFQETTQCTRRMLGYWPLGGQTDPIMQHLTHPGTEAMLGLAEDTWFTNIFRAIIALGKKTSFSSNG